MGRSGRWEGGGGEVARVDHFHLGYGGGGESGRRKRGRRRNLIKDAVHHSFVVVIDIRCSRESQVCT